MIADERQKPRLPGTRSASEGFFYRIPEKSFDWQMITIIIALSWSRDPLDNLQRPQVGRSDYLLIRLITVFDPAFCRVFFLALQANEDRLMPAMIARLCQDVNAHYKSLPNQHLRINLVKTKLISRQGRCPHPSPNEQGAVHDPPVTAP
ncbi:hypothetical protein [Pseudomonas sp. UFMG81]|uniref:hypothetical protein n=1 Tax=Pseudomonas sp. UFMG81 TaxID=2745936 RepID=UPI00188F0CA2|nr:hypothetical protein [Pseudomonas sp. UFMG81]